MKVTLDWDGPVGPGAFPAEPAALEPLLEPGVYLRVKRYANGRTVSYVGQSKTLLSRFDQHLTHMLSLQATIRDSAGAVLTRGAVDERLRGYGDVVAAAATAAEDAARTRFYWAACNDSFIVEDLSVTEAALKMRLETLAATRGGLTVNENIQAIPFGALDEPVFIDNDFSALDAGGRALLLDLLGDDAIVIDPEVEAAGGVEADA